VLSHKAVGILLNCDRQLALLSSGHKLLLNTIGCASFGPFDLQIIAELF